MSTPSTPARPVSRWNLFINLMLLLFGPIALVLGFYGLADWEGAQVLAATKAKWIAKGENFDPAFFIPPAIPDAQNLGAIPLFQQTPDPKTGKLSPLSLLAATNRVSLHGYIPNISKLDSANSATLGKAISARYAMLFPLGTETNPSSQFALIFPAWEEIKSQSKDKPQCVFDTDDQKTSHIEKSYFLPIGMISIGKFGFYESVLELEDHHCENAVENVRVMLLLASGTFKNHVLISGLSGIVLLSYCSNIISLGESKHYWSDNELKTLMTLLGSFNQLKNGLECLRGEAVEDLEIAHFLKANRSSKAFETYTNPIFGSQREVYFIKYWPNGWFDMNSSQLVNYELESIQSIDPTRHLVSPIVMNTVLDTLEKRENSWGAQLPWNTLALETASGVTKQTRTFAKSQVLLDEAQISCVIERYYLKYHCYPKKLDELVPAFTQSLPHDVLGGAPYKYILRSDGTYLLYSIGWNEKDDGGIPSPSDHPEKGDWVWPNHP